MSYGNFVSSLADKLARLGIYDLTAPGIAAELGAYEAGIAPLEEMTENVLNNLFIETADSDALKAKESLIRGVTELPDETRRDFLMHYGDRSNFDMGNEAAILSMVGIQGEFTENYGGDAYALGLTVNSVTGSTQEAAVERLKELLPLHLELVVS